MKALLKISCIYWGSLFLISFSFACNSTSEKSIRILESIDIETISAGSGICQSKDGWWVIGDDTPYLHLLNEKGQIQEKYLLSQIPILNQENYSKSIKPDFEAIDIFNDTLLIIGSGSQFFTRDTAFVFDSQNRKILLKKSLHNLYHKFYLLGDFPIGNSINIEGLANDGKYFYFLHRGNVCGNNRVYRINKIEMIEYLFDDQILIPEFTSYIFELPLINGNKSGFSGACYTHSENALLVTISGKETGDVYSDGEIPGSFIGKIRLNNHIPKKFDYWSIVDANNQFLITKFESIYPSIDRNVYHFIALSDNDNGKTGFYGFVLE